MKTTALSFVKGEAVKMKLATVSDALRSFQEEEEDRKRVPSNFFRAVREATVREIGWERTKNVVKMAV